MGLELRPAVLGSGSTLVAEEVPPPIGEELDSCRSRGRLFTCSGVGDQGVRLLDLLHPGHGLGEVEHALLPSGQGDFAPVRVDAFGTLLVGSNKGAPSAHEGPRGLAQELVDVVHDAPLEGVRRRATSASK
eukprot:6739971-Alexandrium_andersonii.AAC.1